MRIKTSKRVLDLLPEIKTFLGFENNAQVLKLAVSFSINEENIQLFQVSEDGFEIDTHVLFGDEIDYYEYLLQEKFGKELTRTLYAEIIECGIEKLYYYIRMNRNMDRFVRKVAEDLCT